MTREERELIAKLKGCLTLPTWAQMPFSPAECAALLRLIERTTPTVNEED